jgi:hypothetical protein
MGARKIKRRRKKEKKYKRNGKRVEAIRLMTSVSEFGFEFAHSPLAG